MFPLRPAGGGWSHMNMMAVELTARPDGFSGALVGTALIESQHEQ